MPVWNDDRGTTEKMCVCVGLLTLEIIRRANEKRRKKYGTYD